MMDETQKNEFEGKEEQKVSTEQKKEKKSKKVKPVKWIAGALVVGMLAGAAFEGGQYAMQQQNKKQQEKNAEKQAELSALTTSSVSGQDVSSVVSNVMPSIVAIDTTLTSTVEYWGQSYEQESSGSGSGIIIGENENELLLVTNNHVVEGDNATVKVTFSDESTAEATIKGADSNADLAVLAIKKKDLTDETKKNIKIATYNCRWNNFVCNAEAYKIIHGYLKDLYIKYDTSHCINAGGDYLQETRDWGKRFIHVHLKGAVKIEGKVYDNPPAGMDQTDWTSFMGILYGLGYDGGLSIEPESAYWHGELSDRGVDYTIRYFRNMMI